VPRFPRRLRPCEVGELQDACAVECFRRRLH
jgi:hypothetical protein